MQELSKSLTTLSQSGACARTKDRRGSMLESLLGKLSAWYFGPELQIIFSESRSCYHRIRLLILRLRETKSMALMFDRVFQSTPSLSLSDDDSRIEMKPYTLGIQALSTQRPWMSLGDVEIYLAGWCHALQVLCRTKDSAHPSVG